MSINQMTQYILAILLFGGQWIYGQEICDNAIDDDGDGKVDINDEDCQCDAIHVQEDQTYKILNPDFELYSNCPTGYSQMEYCNDWEEGTDGTADYLNTCGWVLDALVNNGLVPFPSGAGCVGTIWSWDYKEYIATCLDAPLIAGGQYSLSFFAGASPKEGFWSDCDSLGFGPVEITLYGNSGCDFPLAGVDCPSLIDPDWQVLGTVTYTPGQWQSVSISFTPSVPIQGIMIGPPCFLPVDYGGGCDAYFVFDNFSLWGEEDYTEIDLVETGSPCDQDYVLSAFVNYPGPGEWQWYFQGVAMNGQTGNEFYPLNNNNQSGVYTVVYQTAYGCLMDSIQLMFPNPDPVEVSVSVCPGNQVECAGEIFNTEGIYEVVLNGYQGCDSIVLCHVSEFELPPLTVLSIDTCGPIELQVHGSSFTTSGYYEVILSDWRGCDSIIGLDLNIMEPKAIIQSSGSINCKPGSTVVLDGSFSTENPLPGGTFYEWSGPLGGIQGSFSDPVVSVLLEGIYCLTVIHEKNGVVCTDSACVVVEASTEPPPAPQIQGDTLMCVGDTLFLTPIPNGMAPDSGYHWIVDTALHPVFFQDALIWVPRDSGTVPFCITAENACGESPLTCLNVSVIGSVTTVISMQTCPPGLAGTDTLFLQAQSGCDSLVITTTTLLPSQKINKTVFTCDPADAGLDTLLLTNQYGCDSTLYIERIYTGHYETSNQKLICGPGMDYTDTLLVSSGPCDSLFITTYMYVLPDTTWQFDQTCDPTQAGTMVITLTGTLGCDSMIIRETTLLPKDSTYIQLMTCDKADVSVTTSILGNQWGCDSLVVTETIYVGSDTQYVQVQTCDPAQAGTNTQVLAGMYCDSVVVTEAIWVAAILTRDTLVDCDATVSVVDTMTFTSSGGCDSLVITLREGGSFTPVADPQAETCAGDEDGQIIVSSTGGGVAPFRYQLDLGPWQTTPAFSDLSPGLYSIEVEDSRGCVKTISGINVGAGQVVQVDAGPDRVVLEGEVETFVVTSVPPATGWQWTAPDPLECPTCPQTQVGPVTQAQVVEVTVVTEQGCVGTDLVKISLGGKPDDPVKVYVPNSFTPNGDGINDVFSVYGNDQVLIVRNLAIFDRWGNALYSRSDLPINDPSAGWDGTFRDEVMGPGVYVYVVEVELQDGSIRLYKGDVTVVR